MAEGHISIPDWWRGQEDVPLDRELALKILAQVTEFLIKDYAEEEAEKAERGY